MGSNENPFATLVSSVSSDIMLFTTPMLPFSAPCRERLATKVCQGHELAKRPQEGTSEISCLRTSAKKERERPNKMIETTVPAAHDRSTGLRPTRSERRFQWIAVIASAA